MFKNIIALYVLDTYSFVIPDIEVSLNGLARNLGIALKDRDAFREHVLDFVRNGRTTTARPRPAAVVDHPASEIERKLAAAKAEALAKGDHGLARSIQNLREERDRLPLPEGGYKNPEEAKAAARFSTNYGNVQQRLKEAGMEPLPPDDRVRLARRMSKAFYRAAAAA